MQCSKTVCTSVVKQNVLSVNDTHNVFSQTNTKMIPNGYLMFEDENFIESSVAKLNALRKSGQFCDVRLQVTIFSSGWWLCFFILYSMLSHMFVLGCSV